MIELKKCSFEEFCKYMLDFSRMQNMRDTLHGLGIVADSLPLVDNYIEMLQRLVNDKNEWISYYIYERNWGKEEGDCVFEHETGEPIPFKTLEDLWNLIQYNQSKRVY